MITDQTLDAAVDAANRFLERAQDLRIRMIDDNIDPTTFPTKESGAVRRASMDLTRALADLRRPPSDTH